MTRITLRRAPAGKSPESHMLLAKRARKRAGAQRHLKNEEQAGKWPKPSRRPSRSRRHGGAAPSAQFGLESRMTRTQKFADKLGNPALSRSRTQAIAGRLSATVPFGLAV